ncbi:3-coathanger stack domain-containing protein [uncultured Tenacibaculum sp.]|uniref:3-coathanger stack domain-containing protein n=1 Tax=uncultured Tenacibaculum sp. TaxID=174713 RepID=UPI00262FF01A|nr:3-coathanger stack domain-containing protein [uncultured Tenacibaculum sp.]
MKLLKKNSLYFFIFLINFTTYAQYVNPTGDGVAVPKGSSFTKFIQIQAGNASYSWYINSVSGTGANNLNINVRSGFLRNYQGINIAVSGTNNFTTNFTQQYTLNFVFRNTATNFTTNATYNLTVNYYVGCESNITITADVNSNQTDNKSTSISITAKNNIKNGANARYDAGQKIYLKPGFKVASGGTFLALIEGCSSTSSKISNNTILKEELLVTSNEKQISTDDIVIYPNPFQDRFNLKTNQKIKSWIIYNMFNKSVLNGNASTINASSLSKGLYNIHIMLDSGETIRKKIVKN